ncbi:hypothetical protein GQ43DRAFT_461556 [Delitschia confertaspora ATCC 74209]|uniref:Uncharacterized protein n=1 Tax=Delitschia confertaspora ATCC 74209 TaxID=1513339 RepID=A0A9P4MU97_9PLEO|nr:hypothetical protein GQ43DRAFT_461556 [Delitschia confertaspora ATCC 74209]
MAPPPFPPSFSSPLVANTQPEHAYCHQRILGDELSSLVHSEGSSAVRAYSPGLGGGHPNSRPVWDEDEEDEFIDRSAVTTTAEANNSGAGHPFLDLLSPPKKDEASIEAFKFIQERLIERWREPALDTTKELPAGDLPAPLLASSAPTPKKKKRIEFRRLFSRRGLKADIPESVDMEEDLSLPLTPLPLPNAPSAVPELPPRQSKTLRKALGVAEKVENEAHIEYQKVKSLSARPSLVAKNLRLVEKEEAIYLRRFGVYEHSKLKLSDKGRHPVDTAIQASGEPIASFVKRQHEALAAIHARRNSYRAMELSQAELRLMWATRFAEQIKTNLWKPFEEWMAKVKEVATREQGRFYAPYGDEEEDSNDDENDEKDVDYETWLRQLADALTRSEAMTKAFSSASSSQESTRAVVKDPQQDITMKKTRAPSSSHHQGSGSKADTVRSGGLRSSWSPPKEAQEPFPASLKRNVTNWETDLKEMEMREKLRQQQEQGRYSMKGTRHGRMASGNTPRIDPTFTQPGNVTQQRFRPPRGENPFMHPIMAQQQQSFDPGGCHRPTIADNLSNSMGEHHQKSCGSAGHRPTIGPYVSSFKTQHQQEPSKSGGLRPMTGRYVSTPVRGAEMHQIPEHHPHQPAHLKYSLFPPQYVSPITAYRGTAHHATTISRPAIQTYTSTSAIPAVPQYPSSSSVSTSTTYPSIGSQYNSMSRVGAQQDCGNMSCQMVRQFPTDPAEIQEQYNATRQRIASLRSRYRRSSGNLPKVGEVNDEEKKKDRE